MADQTKLEPGVYLDNHRGHYIARDTINFAQGLGFPVDPTTQEAVDAYEDHNCDDDYDFETINEATIEAINWLNENQPLDGHYWEFEDGDFGLWADDLADKD